MRRFCRAWVLSAYDVTSKYGKGRAWIFLFWEVNVDLIIKSALLGIGLAMDAFSVSLADGLHEPCMKKGRMAGISMVFALFQAAMPLLGWICVHTVVQYFRAFEKLIPWIALGLLGQHQKCHLLSHGLRE